MEKTTKMPEQMETTFPVQEKNPVKVALSDRLSGVSEYYFATKLRQIEMMNRDGKQVINLGIGSPDQPPHPVVIKTLYEESLKPNQHGYQNYRGHLLLREAVANWYLKYYGVKLDPAKEIVPLMGSKEGLMHICMTYINPGDAVLIPNPGYPTYTSAARIAGAEILPYTISEDTGEPDFKLIEKHELSNVKLMFINYPHMPTGIKCSKDIFQKIIEFGRRHGILIVHDNPYSFILNDNPLSIFCIEGAKDVAVELNSLSKSHNMAGWRIGFLLAREDRISEVMKFKSNMDSGMFLPLQLAAAKALTLGKEWYDSVNKVYGGRREKVYQLMDLLGAKYATNRSGLFVWAKIPDRYESAFELSDKVLESANVFITPGGIFGSTGDRFIRISLCAKEDVIENAIGRIKNAGGLIK